MREARQIHNAMQRLACIARMPHEYDGPGVIPIEGPMPYLIELGDQFYTAVEDNGTGAVIVSPITCFDLDELCEVGALDPWTVLHVPDEITEGIHFRDIGEAELVQVYERMEGQTIAASTLPVMQAHNESNKTTEQYTTSPHLASYV